nr:hypothetical protein [uncultured Desulfobulbus sp.]
MNDIIELIKQNIENDTNSEIKNQTIELLIKARAIEILRPKAEEGMGYAMEAISRIAATTKVVELPMVRQDEE